MSRSKTRVDVVVGCTPELAAKIEAFRVDMETKKGSPVTRTDAIRALFDLGFERAANRPGRYASVPRFNDQDSPIPVSR